MPINRRSIRTSIKEDYKKMIELAIIFNVVKIIVKIGVYCFIAHLLIRRLAKAIAFVLEKCILPLAKDIQAIRGTFFVTKPETENKK